MKILFIGDIFGQTGIRAIKTILPNIKEKYQIDFTIANAENTTNCRGLSIKDYNELISCGIDFMTMGNHTWGHNDIYQILNNKNIIRPYNLVSNHSFGTSGVGTKIVVIKNKTIRITNLIGKSIRLQNLQTNPFIELDQIIKTQDTTDFHIVDFHAESTGEKNALFYEFQNRVTAILGTHSHVQTADTRIINNTAFITDVGLTGPSEGIIGGYGPNIVDRFKEKTNSFDLKEHIGLFQFSAVILDLCEITNKVKNIKNILIYEQNIKSN